MWSDRSQRRMERYRTILQYTILLGMLASTVTYALGYRDGKEHVNRPRPAVCHVVSEDSFPYDCTLDHGAWVPVGQPQGDQRVNVKAFSLPPECVSTWTNGAKEISCAYDPVTGRWMFAPWLTQRNR